MLQKSLIYDCTAIQDLGFFTLAFTDFTGNDVFHAMIQCQGGNWSWGYLFYSLVRIQRMTLSPELVGWLHGGLTYSDLSFIPMRIVLVL